METRGDLALALGLSDAAATIALSYFRELVAVRRKSDGSVVSVADLVTESAIREILTRERPDDAVLCEETGEYSGRTNRRWIVDPIDGTREFLAGRRAWGTNIALEVSGELDIAVLSRPTESQRWWAQRGEGAYTGPQDGPNYAARRLEVSATASLSDARIGGLVEAGSPLVPAMSEVSTWVEDEISVIAALLDGRLDAVIDIGGEIWDQASAALLVTEAGGTFQDPDGGTRLDMGWGLYSNSHLDAALMALVVQGKIPGA